MKIQFYFFFIFFASFQSFAQLGGNSTYQFLNLISSPRQAALGGKVITNIDYDVSQAIYNPAAINSEMDNQLSLNYSNYLGDIGYGTASYAYTFDRRLQTFHIGVIYVDYGNFDGYDENGLSTGNFTGNETALTMGYSFQIGFSDFYAGLNLKLISSQLEQYSSFGGALDFGLIYIDEFLDFNAAVVIRNLGTQFTTYAGLRESLPFELDIGLSQRLQYVPIRWHLTLENLQQWPIAYSNPARSTMDFNGNQFDEKISFFSNLIRHAIVGMELFPERGFNIRMGYSFRRAEELRINEQRNFSGLSFGIGLKFNKFRLSYSHARYSSASNTSFVGIQVSLYE